jgi:hypothetical protein
MRTRKATVSVVALAMAFGAPAGAQGIGPETRPGMTQPGQTLPGDPGPGLGDAVGTPGTTATPVAPRGRQGPTMLDPAATPGMPPVTPGLPGTAATPGEPPAAAPGTVGDPLATQPGADEPPVGADPQGVPGAGQPPAAADPGAGAPPAGDPGAAGDALPTDPATIDEPVGGEAPAAGPGDGSQPEPPATEPPGDGGTDEPAGSEAPGTGGADEPAATDAGGDGAEADPAATEPSGAERITLAKMEDVLREIGADDVQLFFGSIVRASVGEGGRVVMLIGPEDFDPGDGDMTAFGAFDEVVGDLEGAGFADLHQDIDWYVMQGRLDGHAVFVLEAADMGPDAALAAEAVETGGGAADVDALRERLGEAGIDAADDFEPMLFRGELDGSRLFLLVGPESIGADAVELADDELRERLEAAGLREVERVEDVPGLRGAHENGAVLVIGDAEALRDDRD